jgi:carbamoyltransferase
MLFVADIKKERRADLPERFNSFEMMDKLNFQKSDIPAVTHVDHSARVQTVSIQTNERLYFLLKKFKEQTGCSLLVNTSFNVRGEPMVCSPEDAYKCFMNTEMDYLVIENYIFDKKEQPEWNKKMSFDKD